MLGHSAAVTGTAEDVWHTKTETQTARALRQAQGLMLCPHLLSARAMLC